jgi:mRNA-degrading endonuclease RelE of RelBE toxin-antitoxin system
MATIEWKRNAIKQLSKIDSVQRPKIVKAIKSLEEFRTANNVKPLSNHQYDYRLRVGNYRVMFDVSNGNVEIVMIQEVKKRNESTY